MLPIYESYKPGKVYKMSRIITITSGKGGVGKTNISLNLALHLASEGKKTCLFDADLGLANINILLGLQPEYTLKDLVLGRRELEDILIKDYEGIDILPGSSGVQELANLSEEQTNLLTKSLAQLDQYDFLLFDTSAGISKHVVSFCLAAFEVLVVITPEPTSLTDAYSLVKVLSMNGYQGKLSVVINQCKDFTAAKSVYAKFRGAVQKYLGIQVYALGVVFEDRSVVEAVKNQQPLLLSYPNSTASQCIRKIGQKLLEGGQQDLPDMEMAGFWKKWWAAVKAPLKLKEGKSTERKKTPGQDGAVEPSQTEKESAEAPGQRPLETAPTPGKQQQEVETGTIIDQLARSLAQVSEELRLIRDVLERNGGPSLMSKRETGIVGQGRKIKLDLEAFLKAREAANSS